VAPYEQTRCHAAQSVRLYMPMHRWRDSGSLTRRSAVKDHRSGLGTNSAVMLCCWVLVLWDVQIVCCAAAVRKIFF